MEEIEGACSLFLLLLLLLWGEGAVSLPVGVEELALKFGNGGVGCRSNV